MANASSIGPSPIGANTYKPQYSGDYSATSSFFNNTTSASSTTVGGANTYKPQYSGNYSATSSFSNNTTSASSTTVGGANTYKPQYSGVSDTASGLSTTNGSTNNNGTSITVGNQSSSMSPKDTGIYTTSANESKGNPSNLLKPMTDPYASPINKPKDYTGPETKNPPALKPMIEPYTPSTEGIDISINEETVTIAARNCRNLDETLTDTLTKLETIYNYTHDLDDEYASTISQGMDIVKTVRYDVETIGEELTTIENTTDQMYTGSMSILNTYGSQATEEEKKVANASARWGFANAFETLLDGGVFYGAEIAASSVRDPSIVNPAGANSFETRYTPNLLTNNKGNTSNMDAGISSFTPLYINNDSSNNNKSDTYTPPVMATGPNTYQPKFVNEVTGPKNEHADEIRAKAADFIERDLTGEGYAREMEKAGISDELAYGNIHTVNDIVGNIAGSVLLSSVAPGSAVGVLTATGSATEQALNSGATIDEARVVGFGAGLLGGASGAGLDYVKGLASSNTTNLWQLGEYMVAGTGVATAEPVGNSIIEYYTYGKDMVDQDGNPIYNSYVDYYINSGALVNTFIAGGTALLITGDAGLDGMRENYYSTVGITAAELTEDGSESLTDAAIKDDINTQMDGLFGPSDGFFRSGTSDARTSAWEDYFNSKYGSDAVEPNKTQSLGEIQDRARKKFGPTVAEKKPHVITEPRYYDPVKEEFIWPYGEGAKEYSGMTDEELYILGTQGGISALEERGAVIKSFSEGTFDVRIGESYGEFTGRAQDSIESRALSPQQELSTERNVHVYENIDDWTTIDQDEIDKVVYGEGYTKYSHVDPNDKITQIIKVETTAAEWFDSPGGAKQYVYYGVTADGRIATKIINSSGGTQLYKFSMDQLKAMNIIGEVTDSVDYSLLDQSLIPRLAI